MKELFVSFEQALALKLLGFDEPCFGYYNNHTPKYNHPRGLVIGKDAHGSIQDHNEETEGDDLICSAPTFSQAFKFFREKFNLLGYILWDGRAYYWQIQDLTNNNPENDITHFDLEVVQTYERAEIACLDKLIELTKTIQS